VLVRIEDDRGIIADDAYASRRPMARGPAPSPGAPRARIVSLTPSRVDRDSRTFKQAASMARLGYESVVVEEGTSELPLDALPFELRGASRPNGGGSPSGAAQPEPAAPPGHLERAYRKLPEKARKAAERVLRAPLTVARYLTAARTAAGELPPAALYWLHGYHQFPVVWLASRRHRVPFVYDAHDFYPEVIEGGGDTEMEDRALRAFYLLIERACARTATDVVTASEGVASLIEGRTGRRPWVVRNCAELRGGGDGGRDVRAAAGLADSDFLVVMAGNHKPGMRAIDEAVDAFATLPPHAHMAFVGAGYEPVAPRVSALGLRDRVHFLGPVPATEVAAFIRTADLVAVLYIANCNNIAQALPNGFFGAIAAGLPLLYPELPEMRRIAEEHGLGLPIDPTRPDSIAAGVRSLMDDPERAGELRTNAERAREVLNWEREETLLARIVDGAIARPAGRPD
jgi:glycosyltransferase involved in cell wall biosynthesis